MRTLISLLSIAASIYLLLSLALYFLQGKMVFLSNLPGRALTASPADIGLEFEEVSLPTSDDERLHGWYVPATNSRSGVGNGVVLFFHGNAGNISHRLDSIEIFHRLGLDTLIIDYRGYGQSSGKATEQGTYLDAEAAWSYLVEARRVPADQIIVFGRSLGGAVGAWLGAQHTPAAVIIESSFTSGVDMARRLYPFLPAQLITRLRYPVVEYISRNKAMCSTLVAGISGRPSISVSSGLACRSPGYAIPLWNTSAAWIARCWWCTAGMMKLFPSKWANHFSPQRSSANRFLNCAATTITASS